MNYLHYAKAAYTNSTIQNKLDIGTDGIELQLLEPHRDLFWKRNWLDLVDWECLNAIRLIHTPLTHARYKNEWIEYNYGIESKVGIECLRDIAEKASRLSDLTGNKIGIVCHLELPESILKRSVSWSGNMVKQDVAWDTNLLTMASIARMYPGLTFYIENTTLIQDPFTSFHFVEDLNVSNVRCCVDTCHLLMHQYIASRIKSEGVPECSLEEYFQTTQYRIGLIHFAGAADTGSGYGYGKGHGCVTSIKDAKAIYKILFDNNIIVPLTLEVRELNYENCENYKKQLEICTQMEGKQNDKTIRSKLFKILQTSP